MGWIRILLAFAVLFQHVNFLSGKVLVTGDIAVELFFMISGYYMAMVMDSGVYLQNTLQFYKSRFFRLYPTFIAVTLAGFLYYFLLWWLMGKKPANGSDYIYNLSGFWLKTLAYLSNLSMLGQDLFSLFHILPNGEIKIFYSRADTTADGGVILGNLRSTGQAWSIGTEIWFYLLVPFLSRFKVLFLWIIAVASFMLKIYMEKFLDINTYFFFPAQFFLFVLGMIAFSINKDKVYSNPIQKVLWGLILVILFIYPFIGGLFFKIFTYIVFFLVIDSCFKLTKKSTTDRFIGNLSYPIYLVHMLVIQFLTHLFSLLNFQSNLFFGLLVVCLTLSLSIGLYFFLELPVESFRKRFKTSD